MRQKMPHNEEISEMRQTGRTQNINTNREKQNKKECLIKEISLIFRLNINLRKRKPVD